jgi:2-polyprenyl-3-methyl-5-hydroxy-6-metoxy-1,4-benzoquinol methylase
MKVLDVGCGKETTARNKFPDAEIIGIDLNAGDIWADMCCLPFKAHTFDVIFSNHSIEHIQDARLFVSEAHRVLRPYGTMIINTPNLAAWHNRISLLFGLQPRYIDDPRHFKCYTLQGLKCILRGFKVISHHTYGNKRKRLNLLEQLFSFMGMGSNISALFQKEN